MPIPPAATPTSPTPSGAAAPGLAPERGPERFEPIAGLLGVLIPGAGHFFLGERKRAGLIAAGILGLFAAGVLTGGIDVIDRREDPIWFAGQALVGPIAFGVDYFHQEFCKIRDAKRVVNGRVSFELRTGQPDEARDPASGFSAGAGAGLRPPNSKSLGRMNELGTLFATIAGMLNLIAIIDAFYHGRVIDPRGGGDGVIAALAESWRPFLDPLDLHDWWWAFLPPLAFGISVAYKAVRVTTFEGYWRAVAVMTVQIVAAMILLGVAAFLFVEYLVPLLVPMDG